VKISQLDSRILSLSSPQYYNPSTPGTMVIESTNFLLKVHTLLIFINWFLMYYTIHLLAALTVVESDGISKKK
jgi:hypothetical protein